MATLLPYSSRTAQHLAKPPDIGGNRHEWIFTAQAHLIRQGFPAEVVEARMGEFCKAAGWEDRLPEVARNTAAITQAEFAAPAGERIEWPNINHAERARRYAHPRMFAFQECGATGSEAIAALYPPAALVCVAATRFHFDVIPAAAAAKSAHRLQYIVANRMTRPIGKTRAGKESPRTKDNACTEHSRRWAVIEFDTGDAPEDQISVLSSLHTTRAPLTMAVWSGNKSIHGWFDLGKLRKTEKRRFYQFARYLGADNALWNTAALVRMPGGIRENGERQPILFFNPETDQRLHQ
jgi:hypothetical protein